MKKAHMRSSISLLDDIVSAQTSLLLKWLYDNEKMKDDAYAPFNLQLVSFILSKG